MLHFAATRTDSLPENKESITELLTAPIRHLLRMSESRESDVISAAGLYKSCMWNEVEVCGAKKKLDKKSGISNNVPVLQYRGPTSVR